MTDDRLDALLLSAAPRAGGDADLVFDATWARLQAETAGEEARSGREAGVRRRRRGTRFASVTLAVAVAGAGTAAAADFVSTRTGEYLSGWEIDAGGRGEVLKVNGTDRSQVFDEVTADIPFPLGYEAQRRYSLDFYPAEDDVAVTEEVLRRGVARYAVCTWADAWVAADGSGDLPAREAATQTLVASVSWPDIHDGDAPDAIITEQGDHLSYNFWVPLLAEAARAGDRQALLDVVADSYACSYQLLPVIDTVPDYRDAGVR